MANVEAKIFLEFVENHRPILEAGLYKFSGTQTLRVDGNDYTFNSPEFQVRVEGDQFSINPSEIASVFPPDNGLGHYANALPHLALHRETLPWERMPASGNADALKKLPWLALLVLNPEELCNENGDKPASVQEMVSAENGYVKKRSDLGSSWLPPASEDAAAEEPLRVIYVDKETLKAILPQSVNDLGLLAHARKSLIGLTTDSPNAISVDVAVSVEGNVVHEERNLEWWAKKPIRLNCGELKPGAYTIKAMETGTTTLIDEKTLKILPSDSIGDEVAVVVGNRLPEPGKKTIVHLVSFENRYVYENNSLRFDFEKYGNAVPFISLYNWSFTCLTEDETFSKLLQNLNRSSTLRLPDISGADTANRYLREGYVPLPHYFREGSKGVSWYRSPLLPGRTGAIDPAQFPVECADELLRYDTNTGLLDASYAAAWELGRLLCLRDKRVSLELFRWKRGHTRLIKTMAQQYEYPHLPFRANAPGIIVLPEALNKWLSDISLLKGLPFQYLIPDGSMLPPESLRFFYLDPAWIASLLDGALSIGRVNKKYNKMLLNGPLVDSVAASKLVNGVLIRSNVIKGWPTLQVNAYNYPFDANENRTLPIPEKKGNTATAVPCMRMERLSDDILICLFENDFNVLDVHEKPEMIHFGFQEDNGTYRKKPVKPNGSQSDTNIEAGYYEDNKRLIKASVLASGLNSMKEPLGYSKDTKITSAQFALSMVEGVSQVRFIKE